MNPCIRPGRQAASLGSAAKASGKRGKSFKGTAGIAPHAEPDFDAYPMIGFKADHYKQIVVNNQFNNYTWLIDNADGIPMIGINITDFLPHGLYPEYGKVAWSFMSHYARNQETLEVIYTPYAR